MDTLDDLLSKRRRGTLSEAEERRLTAALRASSEYELALLAGDAFDREGASAPGDSQRLRRIIRATERGWAGAPQRRFSARALRTLGVVPVFVAAVAAASFGGHRWFESPTDTPAEIEDGRQGRRQHPAERPPAPPPMSLAPPAQELLPEAPQSQPRAERPELQRPSHVTRREAKASKPSRPLAGTEARPPEPSGSETAPSLFRRANTLRRTDWPAAAATYAELIRRFPGSIEAGIAEVALGKWSLAQGRSGDALEWFRAHQRRQEGPLAPEALWGEARALESLGSRAAAKGPWRQLLERYPESPYAGVARERLRHY
jgi:TolA-binding protein